MIPILYEKDETAFESEGFGRLDAVSCTVTEELNGIYELEMVYPITGRLFSDLIEKRLISARVNDAGSCQPFRIYSISKPINGMITVKAQHISYDLTGIPIAPYEALGIENALWGLEYDASGTEPYKHALAEHSFTTETDVDNTTSGFTLNEVKSARACLGGTKGSILDTFSGSSPVEFEFDGFRVIAHAHRGQDNGVEIRYGKNLKDLTVETTDETQYSGVIASWYDSDQNISVYSEIQTVTNFSDFAVPKIYIYDASSDFEEEPSVSELNGLAAAYRDRNRVGQIKRTLKLSHVALWQTQEYSTMQNLERVRMGDTVHVYDPDLGVSDAFEIIKTEYDVLANRFDSLTVGDAKSNFSSTIQQRIDSSVGSATTSLTQQMNGVVSSLEDALVNSTRLISGVDGGYVVMNLDTTGQPFEILVLDQPDISSAEKIIRINKEGIGFSDSGYDPERFVTAWTIEGEFDANYIKAGTLDGNKIIANTIKTESLEVNAQNAITMVHSRMYTDADGLHIVGYDENGELTAYQAVFTSSGMRVIDNIGNTATLVAEENTVDAVNLTARQYLRIDSGDGDPKSRFQKFYSAVDQEDMYGCFWEETS